MNIKALALFLLILVYFDVSAAEQLTVYRWIDKDNIVHFSQHQPEHDDYVEISMANNKKSSATIAQEKSAENSVIKDDNLAATSVEVDNVNSASNEKCNTARDNLNTLQNFDKIQYKDENGNVKVLGALEKEQQLAMNTKQAEVYCTN